MPRIILRLLEPTGVLHPCPVSIVGASGAWAFPLGLSSFNEQRDGRVQVLQLPDGVAADTLNIAPPTFRIEGTFGTKPKRANGRTLPAQAVVNDLNDFVTYYFNRRYEAARSRDPLIEMAFDDFVHDHHWIVVPQGAPGQRKSNREPLRAHYSLNLTAIRRVKSPAERGDGFLRLLSPGSLAGIVERMSTFE